MSDFGHPHLTATQFDGHYWDHVGLGFRVGIFHFFRTVLNRDENRGMIIPTKDCEHTGEHPKLSPKP